MPANDILDSLDELDLVSIKDIYASIINGCDPLDGIDTYQDTEDDSIMTYCSSLIHLLLSSTPLGRNTSYNTSPTNSNYQLDENSDFNGMDWITYMNRSKRDPGLVPCDFYMDFMDSYRTLHTLIPPMWPRFHQQPWEMHEKTKLLPMMTIPCIPDKKTRTASLIAQDYLQLCPTDINHILALDHAFYTDTWFDLQDIEPLPNLGLKTIHYLPRIDQCDGTVPRHTNDDDEFDLFPALFSPTLFDTDNYDNKITDIDILHSPLKEDTLLQPTPMILTPLFRKKEITLQHTLTMSSDSSECVLIIPGRKNPAEQQQQRGKGTPTKEGTSGYWSKSSKQVSAKPSSISLAFPQPSPIVSLSNSLFDNHPSIAPDPVKHASPVDIISDDPSHQDPGQRDILSMKSLSIDDDFDHSLTEHGSQKTQQDLSSYHETSRNGVTTTKVGDKRNHHSNQVFKNHTFRNNTMLPLDLRSLEKEKQPAFSAAIQPFIFSPGNNVRDFLANRQTRPVTSSSLIGSSKLKRSWCDLDEPHFPAKKKEEWKLAGGKKM